MAALTTLLLLADGRLPSGGHAHSGGLEAAVADGRVRDLSTVEAFLRGRLATTGLVSAAFAAAAVHRCTSGTSVVDLDEGLDARTLSPALRRASRAQGRALLRAGRAMFAAPIMDITTRSEINSRGLVHDQRNWAPHHPIALGIVAAAAGLSPREAGVVAAYGAVSGPASAAVRLLALDPYPVHALLAALAAECDRTADDAAACADQSVDDLPSASAPLLDIGAEVHATWEVRLFAS